MLFMPFNLLLANIKILLQFLFYSSCPYRNPKLKTELAILTGAQITVAKEARDVPLIFVVKAINALSKQSNTVII